jgi:CHAD domain-containing protein
MAKAKAIKGINAANPTGENARKIARARLEELYTWDAVVDQPYAIQGLHNLRIAAKRLRYTLEIFADSLPDACALALKELEQIQEELGALHDSDAMIALLASSTAPLVAQRYGLEQLLRKLQERRMEQYQIFRRHWYHLQELDFRSRLLSALVACQ